MTKVDETTPNTKNVLLSMEGDLISLAESLPDELGQYAETARCRVMYLLACMVDPTPSDAR